MLEKLRSITFQFVYNFRWDKYIYLYDNRISRYSFYFPVLGYIIIFNDEITNRISFLNLIENQKLFLFSSNAKLKFIYFGLLFLSFSHVAYIVYRPSVFRYGNKIDEFINNYSKICAPIDYQNIIGRIRNSGAYSLHGKEFVNDAEDFIDQFKEQISINIKISDTTHQKLYDMALLSLLKDEFFYQSKQNQVALSGCILLSFTGFSLLFLPSVDLLQAVIRTTIKS